MSAAELTGSLIVRAADAEAGGLTEVVMSTEEVRALAQVIDHQHNLLRVAQVNQNGFAQALERQDLVIRLARMYALNALIMPDGDAVKAFLRAYIDDGKLAAIPWPSELPTVCRFLMDLGFMDIGGRVTKRIKDTAVGRNPGGN